LDSGRTHCNALAQRLMQRKLAVSQRSDKYE
jgi:hypothetical protein